MPYSMDGSTDDEANAAGRRTLEACSTGDEWIAGLMEQPGAYGLTAKAEIGQQDLVWACESMDPQGDAPACGGL